MTLTYGFYDSVSSDRLYNAKQMGSIFDGLILDGVYPNYGDALEVLEDTGMDVTVGIGRAWFDHTWSYNDALFGVTVPTADALLDRIDVIYLEVNENVGIRANDIDILAGTPASSPVPPTLTNTSTIHQYALAHIYVGAGVTSIVQANITDMVGTDDTPFVELVTLSEDMQAQIYAIVGDTNPPLIDLIELKGHDHATDTPQIPAAGLATDAVETAKIKNANVTSSKLASSAVIAGKIAVNAVQPGNIATGAVQAGNVGVGGINNTVQLANLIVDSSKLGAGAVIGGKIADGGINSASQLVDNLVDDSKVGARVPQIPYRQGGDPSHWHQSGTTAYAPGAVKILCGAVQWTGTNSAQGVKVVTFPVTFSQNPLIFVQVEHNDTNIVHCILGSAASGAAFTIAWETWDGGGKTSIKFYWMAIGPE